MNYNFSSIKMKKHILLTGPPGYYINNLIVVYYINTFLQELAKLQL